MNIDHGAIFQQCVYDADNRYVDLIIRPEFNNRAFTLIVTDTSNYVDNKIDLYLTREDLKAVIDRLTMVLEK